MKKLGTLLLLSTALAAGAAQANAHHHHKHHHKAKCHQGHKAHGHAARTHWLAGASAGYAWRDGSFGFDSGSNANTPVVDFASAGHIKDNGFLYGVFAGIQTLCNNWVLGVEFAMDWQTKDKTSEFDFTSTSGIAAGLPYGSGSALARFERDTVFTLSTRVGYELASWYNLLPYVRIGVETSRDFLSSAVVLAGDPAIPIPADTTVAFLNGSTRSYRLMAGAGLEMPLSFITAGTSLRVEYNYSANGKGVNAGGFTAERAPFATTLGGVPEVAGAKQHCNSVKASLAYNFL